MKQSILILFILTTFLSTAQSTKKTMQNKKVTIEIWSDIVCPFCFIGKKKMELAITKLKAIDKVEVVWRSFQLDPNFPMDSSISTKEYLVTRKGYPKQQVNMMTSQLTEQGKGYDINFKFDKAHSFNTFNAHRLIQWAKKHNKANALKEALMLTHFTDGVDLSKTENIISVVKKIGLDTTQAKQLLLSTEYTNEVKNDINKAKELGVNGVPYFVIDGKTTISGAQNDLVFENAISNALKDVESVNNENQEGICIPNKGCK